MIPPSRRPRQFSNGTDEEWEQALSQPHVKRALQNPQIAQTLGQAMGQQLGPPPPQRFAEGGSSSSSSDPGIPDPMQTERMQQLEDEMKSEWAPTRYQSGSLVTDPLGQMQELQNEISQLPVGSEQRQELEDRLSGLKGRLNLTGLAGAGTVGAMGMSGAELQGLKNLAAAGPATSGNTAFPMALAGLTGLGMSGRMGAGSRIGGALLSAALAGLGNWYIRRNSRKTQPAENQAAQAQSPANAINPSVSGGITFGTDAQGNRVYSDNGGAWRNAQTGAPASGSVTTDSITGDTSADTLPPVGLGTSGAAEQMWGPTTEDLAAAATDNALARGGEVHSDAAQDRRQMLGILKEKGVIKKARGGFAEEPPPAPAKKGKSILLRKPMGHPIPILHTTIIIAKPVEKEKGQKKAAGGKLEARKPHAIPPKKGPQNGDQYSPYKKGGHVQVPRGSGAAVRGKRFSGIY